MYQLPLFLEGHLGNAEEKVMRAGQVTSLLPQNWDAVHFLAQVCPSVTLCSSFNSPVASQEHALARPSHFRASTGRYSYSLRGHSKAGVMVASCHMERKGPCRYRARVKSWKLLGPLRTRIPRGQVDAFKDVHVRTYCWARICFSIHVSGMISPNIIST